MRKWVHWLHVEIKTWICGGLYLLWLGWKVKYNWKHPYARFRMEMYYKNPEMVWTYKRFREMLGYGYWAWRMNRNGRGL